MISDGLGLGKKENTKKPFLSFLQRSESHKLCMNIFMHIWKCIYKYNMCMYVSVCTCVYFSYNQRSLWAYLVSLHHWHCTYCTTMERILYKGALDRKPAAIVAAQVETFCFLGLLLLPAKVGGSQKGTLPFATSLPAWGWKALCKNAAQGEWGMQALCKG
jgi:hypothetical protein